MAEIWGGVNVVEGGVNVVKRGVNLSLPFVSRSDPDYNPHEGLHDSPPCVRALL